LLRVPYDRMARVSVDSPLARELARRGVRHSWLAEQLGVSKWTFHRIEAGTQPAPGGWYERAAVALGVSVESILPPKPTEKAA
jgi:hypothetical protein